MKVARFFRRLFGLLLLAGFVYVSYRSYLVAPKLLEPEAWRHPYDAVQPAAEPSAATLPAAAESTPAPADPTPEPVAEPTPTPEPTLDPDSPAGRAAALGLPAPPEIDVDSWEFVLANEFNPIGEDFAPQGPAVLEGQQLDERIIEAMRAMVADTRAQNLTVFLSSGYRSYAEQRTNFNNKVAQYPPDGKDSAGNWIVLPPGTSEHQTGLACDITYAYVNPKDRSLADTPMYQYMSQHCQDFGFIVRYPADKEDVTGVMFEPWHFRYVGVEAAQYIMANGICLEEFLSLYREVNTASTAAEA